MIGMAIRGDILFKAGCIGLTEGRDDALEFLSQNTHMRMRIRNVRTYICIYRELP